MDSRVNGWTHTKDSRIGFGIADETDVVDNRSRWSSHFQHRANAYRLANFSLQPLKPPVAPGRGFLFA